MKTILYLGLEAPLPKQEETIIHFPVIRIVPRATSSPDIVHALHSLSSYDCFIFTSKSGVDLFFALNPDHSLTHKQWIAVGTATAQRLKEKGIQNIAVATHETAEGVVALIDSLSLSPSTRFLWPHSAQGRRIIPDALLSRGFFLEECLLYDTLPHIPFAPPDLTLIDEIHFTSPSTIHGFLLAYGSLPLNKTLHCIGPVTATALKNVADIRGEKDTLTKTF